MRGRHHPSADETLQALTEQSYDVLLLELALAESDALNLLAEVRQRAPATCFAWRPARWRTDGSLYLLITRYGQDMTKIVNRIARSSLFHSGCGRDGSVNPFGVSRRERENFSARGSGCERNPMGHVRTPNDPAKPEGLWSMDKRAKSHEI